MLWPGLTWLWTRGDIWGLAVALLFSLVLNFSLIVTFVWFETISASAQRALWISLGAGWGISIVAGYWWLGRQLAPHSASDMDQWFCQAQQFYLRGNWIEAELSLLKILGRNASDPDARLFLATLYRHTKRFAESEAELCHLERFDSAVKWRWEIDAERRLLREFQSRNTPSSVEPPAAPMAAEVQTVQQMRPLAA